ncbi:MAG: nucleotidyltransferase domain-containing protein [Candidatus Bathyarchaeota archaeon]
MSSFVEKVYREVDEYVSCLKKKFNVKLVILFGSIPKNSWIAEKSDVDLLIVAEGLKPTPSENYEILKLTGIIEPLGYNPESFLEVVKNLKSFVVFDALEHGKVIHADDEYLGKVKTLFEEVKKKYNLKRDEKGWSFRIKQA